MRWYEYKMEADDLHAPEDLKAKLLAMADTLPEEEKNRPMMPAQADNTAVVRPQKPPKKAKLIHFSAKPVGALAACLAVCVVGYNVLGTGKLDIGAKSSNMALYSANSSAASTAAGFTTQQAMLDATPEAVTYDLDQAAVLSENDAAAAEDRQASTSPKIIYTANLTLESKDYDTARAALDAALNDAGGYLESSSEYSDVGSSRSVNLTFRVPEENYQSFLDAVAQAGNVTYKSQQADDVTTQYMDVETRLANLEAQRTRLQELQAQADNLSDLLQIETSLTDVQSQIESWQSQLDWYSNQVSCCTVYITLNEVETLTPTSTSFGAKLLAALPGKEAGADAILIEAELPEKADDPAMAVRRLGFYARCGAVDTGWTEKLFGASWFRVLTLAAPGQQPMGAEDACRALADCYRRVIGEPKWRQYIELYRPDGTTAQLL